MFLIFKQLEFYLTNDMDYKFIYWGSNLKEENYMKNLAIKTNIQLTNLFLVLHKLVIGLYIVFSARLGLYFILPFLLIIISAFYTICTIYSSFANIKRFYQKLDLL